MTEWPGCRLLVQLREVLVPEVALETVMSEFVLNVDSLRKGCRGGGQGVDSGGKPARMYKMAVLRVIGALESW